MKRFWIGIALLAVLLIAGSIISYAMHTIHTHTAALLEQAAEAAQNQDWKTATQMAELAQAHWQNWRHFTAAFADHVPMDELDGLFAELAVLTQAQEMPNFAATCAHLAKLAQAMADSHSLYWWNLL